MTHPRLSQHVGDVVHQHNGVPHPSVDEQIYDGFFTDQVNYDKVAHSKCGRHVSDSYVRRGTQTWGSRNSHSGSDSRCLH